LNGRPLKTALGGRYFLGQHRKAGWKSVAIRGQRPWFEGSIVCFGEENKDVRQRRTVLQQASAKCIRNFAGQKKKPERVALRVGKNQKLAAEPNREPVQGFPGALLNPASGRPVNRKLAMTQKKGLARLTGYNMGETGSWIYVSRAKINGAVFQGGLRLHQAKKRQPSWGLVKGLARDGALQKSNSQGETL